MSLFPAPKPSQQTSVKYEVVTPRGVIVETFDHEDRARIFVAERRAKNVPGLEIVEVTTTTTRRRVYRPRLRLVR